MCVFLIIDVFIFFFSLLGEGESGVCFICAPIACQCLLFYWGGVRHHGDFLDVCSMPFLNLGWVFCFLPLNYLQICQGFY